LSPADCAAQAKSASDSIHLEALCDLGFFQLIPFVSLESSAQVISRFGLDQAGRFQFYGRLLMRDLDQRIRDLFPRTNPEISVIGPSGIGKSRMLAAWAASSMFSGRLFFSSWKNLF
jgi:hypothetical protein